MPNLIGRNQICMLLGVRQAIQITPRVSALHIADRAPIGFDRVQHTSSHIRHYWNSKVDVCVVAATELEQNERTEGCLQLLNVTKLHCCRHQNGLALHTRRQTSDPHCSEINKLVWLLARRKVSTLRRPEYDDEITLPSICWVADE